MEPQKLWADFCLWADFAPNIYSLVVDNLLCVPALAKALLLTGISV